MTTPATAANRLQPGDEGCWNAIGITGDRSCPRLAEHGHCRHCDAYTSAAARLLDRAPPAGYVTEATQHFARPKSAAPAKTVSLVVFRTGAEWLALPTPAVVEVAEPRPIHSLPHRRGGPLLGVANIRGELLVCVGLRALLGLAPVASGAPERTAAPRFIVAAAPGGRIALPVDEVRGVHRFPASDVEPAPAATGRAGAHAPTIVRWGELTVGCLDAARVFQSVEASLA